jgi:hypothetical protein
LNRHDEETSKLEGKQPAVTGKGSASPKVPGRAGTVLDLQRAAGNRAVSRVLAKPSAGKGSTTVSTPLLQRVLEAADLTAIEELLDKKLDEKGVSGTSSSTKTNSSNATIKVGGKILSKDDPEYWQKTLEATKNPAQLSDKEKKAKAEVDKLQAAEKKQKEITDLSQQIQDFDPKHEAKKAALKRQLEQKKKEVAKQDARLDWEEQRKADLAAMKAGTFGK